MVDWSLWPAFAKATAGTASAENTKAPVGGLMARQPEPWRRLVEVAGITFYTIELKSLKNNQKDAKICTPRYPQFSPLQSAAIWEPNSDPEIIFELFFRTICCGSKDFPTGCRQAD
ncbi:hypothetical protein KP004_05545 [Geomonas oryzisoli]|uniref:Uncharacterized protein n=1 Tax=Geomonas oryzisoli TaxID=2847992 RepID=A0ABX8JD58_9BACT|nr:hypothetical protein [Geomonas oryzisoli]QWV94647.1 hypothetical protein KP004_05545 [Geomonas oryzisoli]